MHQPSLTYSGGSSSPVAGTASPYSQYSHPDVLLTSDASGNWGCGAFSGKLWLQLKWTHGTCSYNITVKELLPIVLALAMWTWGNEWKGLTVQARCDNAAVVAIVNSGSSRGRDAMHLRRCLAFIVAKCEINLVCSHIAGVENSLADALSRDNAPYFRSHWPQAQPYPVPIPAELLDLLILEKPDWRSQRWIDLWSSTFNRV